MFPLFALHLSIFEIEPSLFTTIHIISLLAFRCVFDWLFPLSHSLFIKTVLALSPFFFLVNRVLFKLHNPRLRNPIISIFLRLERIFPIALILALIVTETSRLVVHNESKKYLVCLITMDSLVLFLLACLFFIYIEIGIEASH